MKEVLMNTQILFVGLVLTILTICGFIMVLIKQIIKNKKELGK